MHDARTFSILEIHAKFCMQNGPLLGMATRLNSQILLFFMLASLRFSVPAVR